MIAMPEIASQETKNIARKEKWLFFIFSSVVAFLFLFHLGSQAFIDYDEATYAQVTKETVAGGHFLPLLLRGEPWVDKPPLYFWAGIISSKIFGLNEFALRLPSALSGIISVFLTFLIARILTNSRKIALMAVGILLTTGIFLEASRQVRLDVPVTMFLLLAFYSFLKGRENPRWYILIGVATILGFLSKSVVSFLIAPLVILYSILYRHFSWLKSGFFWLGWLFGALILTPWILTDYLRNKTEFIDTYLRKHLTGRISERLIGGNVSNMTYLSHLLRFAEPWIFIFFSSIAFLVFKLRKSFFENFVKWKNLIFVISSTLIIFLPFGIAQTKLLYYLTPLYPFLAIACAIILDTLLKSNLAKPEMIVIKSFVALLFVIGSLCSIFVGFHINNAVGATYTSEEERQIGYAIANFPKETKVYAVDHLFWDTIYYYGNGKNISLLQEKENMPESFLLIIPTVRLYYSPPKELSEYKNVQELYKGPGLTALSIQ